MPIQFYYDTEDYTLETINENGIVLSKGSNDNVDFEFHFTDFTSADLLNNQCIVNIERPDGSSSNNIISTPITNGSFYYLLYSNWITAIAGTVKFTVKLVDPVTQQEDIYGLATIQVLDSANQSTDTIDDLQYQAILHELGLLQSELTATKYSVILDEDMEKGDLAMFVGTVGGSGKIKVAKASGSGLVNINTNPEIIFGVVVVGGLKNEVGVVQTSGLIKELDTTMYQEEKILLPDSRVGYEGKMIEFDDDYAPRPPKNRMPIAVCIYSHVIHGIMIVRPTFMPKMSQVQDVDLSNVSHNSVLRYNSETGNWEAIAGNLIGGGVFYDDTLPDEEYYYDGMTWFDV